MKSILNTADNRRLLNLSGAQWKEMISDAYRQRFALKRKRKPTSKRALEIRPYTF